MRAHQEPLPPLVLPPPLGGGGGLPLPPPLVSPPLPPRPPPLLLLLLVFLVSTGAAGAFCVAARSFSSGGAKVMVSGWVRPSIVRCILISSGHCEVVHSCSHSLVDS